MKQRFVLKFVDPVYSSLENSGGRHPIQFEFKHRNPDLESREARVLEGKAVGCAE